MSPVAERKASDTESRLLPAVRDAHALAQSADKLVFLHQKVGQGEVEKLSQHVPLITGGGTDKFIHVYDLIHIRRLSFLHSEFSHQFLITSGSLSYCPDMSSPHS